MECYLSDGFYYRHLYDQVNKSSVWACFVSSCHVKVITDDQKIITKWIGNHAHKTAKEQEKPKRTSMMGDLRKKKEDGLSDEEKLKNIKRDINLEFAKFDYDRYLRNTMLRKTFLIRVWGAEDL
ncbi:hypothetical protein GWI33_017178 [Rhynchophorus ferrugineus]|uniref:FLYWCH-type domain-containing protein n=1 Tax=Rhynchophorus ferrugineus TaxID=354439 RepID=A0A834HW13_RHYFE|nr:hypothetical protein GWI33_017178 [Rhynchophorus ferrugineus]